MSVFRNGNFADDIRSLTFIAAYGASSLKFFIQGQKNKGTADAFGLAGEKPARDRHLQPDEISDSYNSIYVHGRVGGLCHVV
ncbi:hypothetical protein ACLKA7_012249 [Drosophila subpalustris]